MSGFDTLTSETVCTELDRVLASAAFQSSERLGKFLRFVVERTLAGEGDQLKEYRIGVEVFGRPASYDPRIDPVVRVEARRLRARLAQYYEKEGLREPIRIDIPKGGYAPVFAAVPAPEVSRIDTSPGEANGSSRHFLRVLLRHWNVSTAVLLFVVLVIAAGAFYRRRSRFPSTSGPPSVAVLPFLNLTGNPDNEYLSDGLTDELTSSIANTPGLRVVARTSAFKFKGKSEDVREIGKQLNVSSILEGSIQAKEDRLRITAQLIRTSDGSHVWSETYERPFRDSFALEDEISHALSAALRIRLSGEAESHAKGHNVDPVAHEFYLRGQYMAQRLSWDDVKRAMNYFNQAIDHDPLYAEAYAALAAGYAVQGANAWAEPAEVYPKARAAAQRAIELEPNQPDAHAILANITFFYDWDFPDAEREFKRAIELNPNSARAHQWYGILLYYSQRFDEAREQFRQAKEVNPLAIQIDLTMVMLYEAQRRYDTAIELDRKILGEHDHSTPRALLGLLYADKKQYKEAIEEGQRAVALAGKDPDMTLVLANLYAQSGQRDQALAIMNEVLSKSALIPPFTVAGVYAELGDKEKMYQWLDKGLEQRSPAMLKLDISEVFAPYRSEPRFQEILRKTGLIR